MKLYKVAILEAGIISFQEGRPYEARSVANKVDSVYSRKLIAYTECTIVDGASLLLENRKS